MTSTTTVAPILPLVDLSSAFLANTVDPLGKPGPNYPQSNGTLTYAFVQFSCSSDAGVCESAIRGPIKHAARFLTNSQLIWHEHESPDCRRRNRLHPRLVHHRIIAKFSRISNHVTLSVIEHRIALGFHRSASTSHVDHRRTFNRRSDTSVFAYVMQSVFSVISRSDASSTCRIIVGISDYRFAFPFISLVRSQYHIAHSGRLQHFQLQLPGHLHLTFEYRRLFPSSVFPKCSFSSIATSQRCQHARRYS